ncbi:LuxR C-terminal-related transcriptional regulator [Streptacidiphilus monticola]
MTRRELEVLVLLARGDGTVEIARGLEMTVNTARTHIQSVLDKLGVHSRLEAVALVNRLGVDLTAL